MKFVFFNFLLFKYVNRRRKIKERWRVCLSVSRCNGRIEHFFELIYLYGELIVYCPMSKCGVFLFILPQINYISGRAEGYLKC